MHRSLFFLFMLALLTLPAVAQKTPTPTNKPAPNVDYSSIQILTHGNIENDESIRSSRPSSIEWDDQWNDEWDPLDDDLSGATDLGMPSYSVQIHGPHRLDCILDLNNDYDPTNNIFYTDEDWFSFDLEEGGSYEFSTTDYFCVIKAYAFENTQLINVGDISTTENQYLLFYTAESNIKIYIQIIATTDRWLEEGHCTKKYSLLYLRRNASPTLTPTPTLPLGFEYTEIEINGDFIYREPAEEALWFRFTTESEGFYTIDWENAYPILLGPNSINDKIYADDIYYEVGEGSDSYKLEANQTYYINFNTESISADIFSFRLRGPGWIPPTATPTFTNTHTPTSTFTPTPTNTPTTPMEVIPYGLYEFDQDTLSENGWAEIPGGFVPDTPNGFVESCAFNENEIPSSKDQKGIAVKVSSQEVVFLYAKNPVDTQGMPVLLRMTVRSSSPEASVALVALRGDVTTGDNVDGSIATHVPFRAESFVDSEKRLVLVYQPDKGSEITPAIQVSAFEQPTSVTVWIDKLEIIKLDPKIFGASPEDPTPTPGRFTGETITIPLDLPDGAKLLEMVLIPAGIFMMGSPESERGRNSDETQHEVTLTRDFYIGQYEITQAQYEAVMGSKPSYYIGPNNPVESVAWYDAAAFCNRLSETQGLQPVYTENGDWPVDWNANGFRLPTEAKWKYACRARTTWRFSHGNVLDVEDYCEYSGVHDQYMWWCGNNNIKDYPYGTKEVGLKSPNQWGLFDMHGNVWEWCQDWYGSYGTYAQIDPMGPERGLNHIRRGGSWFHYARQCRSAYRNGFELESPWRDVGFRIVMTQTYLE